MILVWSIVFFSLTLSMTIVHMYAHKAMPTFLEFMLAIALGCVILSGLIALARTSWWAWHAVKG